MTRPAAAPSAAPAKYVEGGPQVRVLQAEPPQPVGLVRPADLVVEPGDQLGAPGGVPLLHAVELAVLLGPLQAELPDVGEHPVPRVPGVGFLGDDDRLVDECAHQVEDLVRGQIVGRTDGGRGLQVESAGEHRGPRPEPLLELGAQVVGPLDAGSQRLVPVLGVAVALVEHRQPLGEAVADLLRRQHPDPGRGELDRQRDPVQLAAQGDDRRRVVRGQLEVRACRGRRGPANRSTAS